MKRLMMLMADGCEECEALVTRDVLKRAGIEVEMKSIMGREVVVSQNGLLIKCDSLVDNDYAYGNLVGCACQSCLRHFLQTED